MLVMSYFCSHNKLRFLFDCRYQWMEMVPFHLVCVTMHFMFICDD